MSSFQSYLILARTDVRKKTLEILKPYGLLKIKVSPDIFFIIPQKTSISINKIRDLKKHIFQKPVSLPYKYIIIEEAHKLTMEAQSAFLKILEEPPASAIIVLEAKDKFSFLPTILSRVVTVQANPEKQQAEGDQPIFDTESKSELLIQVSQVKNPEDWLDNQIILLTQKLEEAIKHQERRGEVKKITKTIKLCSEAKKMIAANVNPKFVLANLIFSIK